MRIVLVRTADRQDGIVPEGDSDEEPFDINVPRSGSGAGGDTVDVGDAEDGKIVVGGGNDKSPGAVFGGSPSTSTDEKSSRPEAHTPPSPATRRALGPSASVAGTAAGTAAGAEAGVGMSVGVTRAEDAVEPVLSERAEPGNQVDNAEALEGDEGGVMSREGEGDHEERTAEVSVEKIEQQPRPGGDTTVTSAEAKDANDSHGSNNHTGGGVGTGLGDGDSRRPSGPTLERAVIGKSAVAMRASTPPSTAPPDHLSISIPTDVGTEDFSPEERRWAAMVGSPSGEIIWDVAKTDSGGGGGGGGDRNGMSKRKGAPGDEAQRQRTLSSSSSSAHRSLKTVASAGEKLSLPASSSLASPVGFPADAVSAEAASTRDDRVYHPGQRSPATTTAKFKKKKFSVTSEKASVPGATAAPSSNGAAGSVVDTTTAAAAAAADGGASPARKKRKRVPWGGKDWAGRPISAEALAEVKSSATVYGVGPDGRMVGEDGNHFFCR